MCPLRAAHTTPATPIPSHTPHILERRKREVEKGPRVALKVILHVSTGMGPSAPCALAPGLDHNTGSIDSWEPYFPRFTQN